MKFDLGSTRTPWRAALMAGVLALTLTGCGTSAAPEDTAGESIENPTSGEEAPTAEPVDDQPQGETCDWESPKISGPADVPTGQDGELAEILVGSWQHTHTDDGNGFEESVNDHRYVFPSPERMLYCQHVPGATDYAENAADVVLNDTTIELPGGRYSYTITAWNENTLVWDNPVGDGFVYLLQRR